MNDAELGFIHIDPIPSTEELEKIYKDEYYTTEKKDYIDYAIEDLEWWETTYSDKYDTFETYITSDGKSILDIGCGPGYFLLYGKKRGWDCYGVDPSSVASKHAQDNGLNISNALFDKNDYHDMKFDVIHMHNVLEHISNPIQLVNDATSLLKAGGILCVGVPNDFSPFQKILWKNLDFKPWWLAPPHHINYFTPESLTKLIEKNKLNVFLKESSFPMELFLLLGDNYIDNPKLGREMHFKRKKFDLALSKNDNNLKRELYQSLAKLNLGREIILYAKK